MVRPGCGVLASSVILLGLNICSRRVNDTNERSGVVIACVTC